MLRHNRVAEETSTNRTPIKRSVEWARNHKFQLGLGAMALSAAATFATGTGHEAVETAKEYAPWVGGGMLAMEGVWIGGAGIMAASVGEHIGNPLTMKSRFPEIARKANESKLFKTGLIINTVGAVSEFAIPAAVVCSKLPPESWGILTPSLIDLGITVAVRKAIIGGMHEANAEPTETLYVEPPTNL